jgi:hypothetical protein
MTFADPRPRLTDDPKTFKRLQLNHRRNKEQDHTALLDEARQRFVYAECRDEYWNPEELSLLYGTPLWEGATQAQRVLLNQLYWVAYYSQIISAEIATIYFNQTSATGLYALNDFRLVCDTLDLESSQERAHIDAFRSVSEQVEEELFGERVFSYAMRGPFAETMVHPDSGALKEKWKRLQLQTYGLLSAGNAFIACQYFTVRGLRTLNGKLVQHRLSRYFAEHADQEHAPVPSKISYYHFQDESYHFNSSMLISQDVLRSLPEPTPFERMVGTMAIKGCQRDHYHFSVAVNGIFWYDPAVFTPVYKLLRSRHFGFDHGASLDMLRRCFGEETDGLHLSRETHRTALESYRKYLVDMEYVSAENRVMSLMSGSDIEGYLMRTRRALQHFGDA